MNNSKVVIFLSCLFAATLTAPLVTAAGHGGGRGGGFSGGHSFAGRPGIGMSGRPGMGMLGRPGMGMPGRLGMGMPGRPGMGMPGHFGMGMPGRPGMGMRSGFTSRSMGRMPVHRDPMMNSPSGLRRFGDRDFDRDDRFRRFNRFNDGDFDRDDRFHRFNHFNNNQFIFIGDFGFPWWWGWGWGPWWGWGGYPYGYYGYGYPYGSGYGYGSSYGQYGEASHSRVAELQRRLARAGYYHGSIDGVLGPQTRRAIRAYAADHGQGS